MSSPNGRKRYRDYQERRHPSAHSPDQIGSAKSKASHLLQDGVGEDGLGDGIDDIDDEDDEETLQLKLQAIEARLKLKRLQQLKKAGKSEAREGSGSPRPSSSSAASEKPAARASVQFREQRRTVSDIRQEGDSVQVPVSPAKREVPKQDATSPRRIRLGIDKGMKGSEVSLKRPPVVRKDSPFSPIKRSAGARSSTDTVTGSGTPKVKSFSERIAESRVADRLKQAKAEEQQRKRTSAFALDKKEVEHYHALAQNTSSPVKAASPRKNAGANSFSREEVVRAFHRPEAALRRPAERQADEQGEAREIKRIRSGEKFVSEGDKDSDANKKGDPTKFEPFSGLNLSKRILPHSFMKRTMEDKTPLRIPYLLKHVKSPDYELPDSIDGDYVVFGIVASKSSPRDHNKEKHHSSKPAESAAGRDDDGRNNSQKYMVLSLTDLDWSIDLFLFATAFPRYYKLTPGTVVAILNPNIMPPPPTKTDTGKFSLTLNSADDTVLEIGKAQDLGFCKSVKKDGSTCDAWVDARKTEFCEFHVDLQIRKTTAGRMEVNSGPGIFGPGGRAGPRTFYGKGRGGGGAAPAGGVGGHGLKDPSAMKIDKETKSPYYIVSRNPAHPVAPAGGRFPGAQSAAEALDVIDDPFLSNLRGRSNGDGNTEARMRKRLADKQRERDIAQKLGEASKSIGSEYLRIQHALPAPGQHTPAGSRTSSLTASSQDRDRTAGVGPEMSIDLSKKKAAAVKLRPGKKRVLQAGSSKGTDGDTTTSTVSDVKKTRFVTARGIRDAGRESSGSTLAVDEGDDDDLDII